MNWILLGFLSFVLIPFLTVLIDGAAALHARNMRYSFGNTQIKDFTVLVPIYGNIRYLENIDYPRQYGEKVLLCTTGDESQEFYQQLQEIADLNGFRIFRDQPTRLSSKHTITQKHRATSGTIRDRLIRNALSTMVTTRYVVPVDADTITCQPITLPVGELAPGTRHRVDPTGSNQS